MHQLPYRDYGSWMERMFPFKVQKLPLDAGFTCPNRDGRLGWGGCSYCNNEAFTPNYHRQKHLISEQIQAGKEFFQRKYPKMRFIAYLQAHTNTYAQTSYLKSLYEQVLQEKDIVGLVIATRPDCVNEELLDYLQEISKRTFIVVEYGIETANESTLKKINRGHNFMCSQNAVQQTANRGILTCGHIILGLPGEDHAESLRQASIISRLPLNILKIHQLQIVKNTQMEQWYNKDPFPLYSIDEYVALLAGYIQRLRSDIVLERFVSQTPPHLLVAPNWGVKPQEFNERLIKYMYEKNVWQGKMNDRPISP